MAIAKRSAHGSSTRPAVPEAIVREAIRLFGEHSYPVVGMRDLSKAVGLQPGSLYAHIRSKEELLLAIVEEGITNYIDAISEAIDTDEPADIKLRAAIRAHMRVLAETVEQTKVTFNQWRYLGPDGQARALALRQEYEDLFLGVAQQGIKDGVLRPVPHLKAALLSIIGGLNFAAEWYNPAKPETPEGLADAVADLLLEGLATNRTSRSSAARAKTSANGRTKATKDPAPPADQAASRRRR
ncbi:TetR/AcrR family transcriptional regulator [Sporichthya polymorpha]|uniref:TetR/AcrR family transcriptional regulator n=1 Tax=Sporichthya polymorpha TaxID=35751 RepID=UPI00037C64BF|nr:TetR/AcrR family transcriptional regulator [Sporichthya polymorpha]